MLTHVSRSFSAVALVAIAATPVRAQFAVVDTPAFAQLIQQLKTMQLQVQTTESQLLQAKQSLQAMTGDRGMELLLRGTLRNYLPVSWLQLTATTQAGGVEFPALAADVRSTIAANAVLTPQQLSLLPPVGQQRIAATRRSNALQQALTAAALANASARFAAVQSLIDSIGRATDQKGILDLQARISAEIGMLQNEQTKLQVLSHAMEAKAAVDRQQEREQVIAAHGSFGSRFQPSLDVAP